MPALGRHEERKAETGVAVEQDRVETKAFEQSDQQTTLKPAAHIFRLSVHFLWLGTTG